MQILLPQPELDAMVVLTQASVPPTDSGSTGVSFDLDVSGSETSPISEKEMRSRLERFHDCEHSCFEDSITDLTRSLFGERKEY